MTPGFDDTADTLEAIIDGADAFGLLEINRAQVIGSTDGGGEYPFVVDCDDERIFVHHAPYITGAHQAADTELVLTVGREVVFHHHAAARAKRQAVDVLVLAGVGRAGIDA